MQKKVMKFGQTYFEFQNSNNLTIRQNKTLEYFHIKKVQLKIDLIAVRRF